MAYQFRRTIQPTVTPVVSPGSAEFELDREVPAPPLLPAPVASFKTTEQADQKSRRGYPVSYRGVVTAWTEEGCRAGLDEALRRYPAGGYSTQVRTVPALAGDTWIACYWRAASCD